MFMPSLKDELQSLTYRDGIMDKHFNIDLRQLNPAKKTMPEQCLYY